jgi:hypothetical protein
MLNTVIDFEVLKDFWNTKPDSDSFEEEENNKFNIWNSFRTFILSGSNLTLTNFDFKEEDYQKPENLFITQLINGKKDKKIVPDPKFKIPHNFKFPENQNIQTIFFLNENDPIIQTKYRKENGYFFAFTQDYMDKWKELSYHENSVLHHRKSVLENKRFNWEKFTDYLLPFTDVIICDNFLFKDVREIENKFGNLLKSLNKATPVKYNLLIYLNKYDLDFTFHENVKELYKYLTNENLIDSNRVNLGIIHTAKEHDRFIFFNYLEVDMGKIPDRSARSTKITFLPYTSQKNYSDANLVLNDLREIAKTNESEGHIANKLLKLINND